MNCELFFVMRKVTPMIKSSYFVLFAAIGLLLMTSSCANHLKMIERGQYDKAFYRSLDRMEGKKNKREKFVAHAEDAFQRANARDFEILQNLRWETDERSMREILYRIDLINKRQERVRSFLPMTDRSGYTAHFEFLDTRKWEEEASGNLFALWMEEGERLLEVAREGEKYAAREAYDLFARADNLRPGQSKVRERLDESLYLGTSRVYMSVSNSSHMIIPARLERSLTTINFSEFRHRWVDFSTTRRNNEDYHMEIEITNISISPERLIERVYEVSKDIENKVKVPGTDSTITETETVFATITEITMTREAIMNANIIIRDLAGRKVVHHEPVYSTYGYDNVINTYKGDRRALPSRMRTGGSIKFPNDEEMVWQAGELLKDKVLDYVRRFDL